MAQEDNVGLSFPGREEMRRATPHTLIVTREFATCRRTHVEPVSRTATESWTAGDMNMAHDGGYHVGLHDDNILVLAFLRIAIADRLFLFMSRP